MDQPPLVHVREQYIPYSSHIPKFRVGTGVGWEGLGGGRWEGLVRSVMCVFYSLCRD